MALDFDADRVSGIRDFLFARYAMEGISVVVIDRDRAEVPRRSQPAT